MRSEKRRKTSSALKRSTEKSRAHTGNKMINGLQMAPELMLDLARKAAELVVKRIENLPKEEAWDGEFRQGSWNNSWRLRRRTAVPGRRCLNEPRGISCR